jgi:hypothetical protein
MARCPAHDDRTPSLSICDAEDNKVLVRCHAGCEQRDLIAALQSRGLWQKTGRASGIARNHRCRIAEKPDTDALKRSEAAGAIWQASQAVEGTPVATYMRSRGLNLPASPALRFHAGLKHPSGGVWPAMVALVTLGGTGSPIAVHRTFLARDGSGKAPANPAKMMLGPCRGGAVRLADVQPDHWLIIGEGIETTLTVMEACALPGWAALSANGIRSLNLPPTAAKVLICCDHDANGTGQRAAREVAERFLREGRRVRIATPLNSGTDFNDILRLADLGRLQGGA